MPGHKITLSFSHFFSFLQSRSIHLLLVYIFFPSGPSPYIVFVSPQSNKPTQQESNQERAMEMLHGRHVISQEEVNGVVRVKIVISKKELKQMVSSLGHQKQNVNGGDNYQRKTKAPTEQESFEKMLYVLRKRHEKRVEAKKKKGEQVEEWQPALQSIPEEI
ncbi:hypothetical protein LUZ60_016752 [Juncus effusus]|nr:hypothetical protein LUZ60_016752 [Juncus effusus]